MAEIAVEEVDCSEHLEHLLFLYDALNESGIDCFLATGLCLNQTGKTDVVDWSEQSTRSQEDVFHGIGGK